MRLILTSALDDELLLGRSLREHVRDIDVPDAACVVLDPLCPLVPAWFVADLAARTASTGVAHAGVRPVTDTVKVVHDGLVGETLDRSRLWQVVSPVVLPAPADVPGTLAELVAALPEVVLAEAPASARRIADASDLRLLEAVAAVAPRPEGPPGT